MPDSSGPLNLRSLVVTHVLAVNAGAEARTTTATAADPAATAVRTPGNVRAKTTRMSNYCYSYILVIVAPLRNSSTGAPTHTSTRTFGMRRQRAITSMFQCQATHCEPPSTGWLHLASAMNAKRTSTSCWTFPWSTRGSKLCLQQHQLILPKVRNRGTATDASVSRCWTICLQGGRGGHICGQVHNN